MARDESALNAEEAARLLQSVTDVSRSVDEVIAETIRESDSQSPDALSKSSVYSAAFARLGQAIAPGGEAGLTASEFRDVMLEFLTTVAKTEQFSAQVQELLNKRNSDQLSRAEQTEFEAVCQLNEALSTAIAALRLKPEA